MATVYLLLEAAAALFGGFKKSEQAKPEHSPQSHPARRQRMCYFAPSHLIRPTHGAEAQPKSGTVTLRQAGSTARG